MIVLGTGGAGSGGKIVTQGQLLGIYAGKAVLAYHMCLARHTHKHIVRGNAITVAMLGCDLQQTASGQVL